MTARAAIHLCTLLASLVIGGCSSDRIVAPPAVQHVARGVAFELAPGGSAYVTGIRLTVSLETVLDYRCPTRVLCIWEGYAQLNVRTLRDGARKLLVLETHSAQKTVELDELRVSVVNLAPIRETPASIALDRYRVRLVVR